MAQGKEEMLAIKANKQRLKEEKKKLKFQEKEQRKEARARARELAMEEAQLTEDMDSSPLSVALVTVIIVFVWIAIICLLIKLDVGGFGTNVMTPLLKNVPVISNILPKQQGMADESGYEGYATIQDAVDYIRVLELQLEAVKSENVADETTLQQLNAEIERLKTFESNQLEFQKIKNEFYEEVVYAENGPGAEEYAKYYETMDPSTAEALYKEVIRQQQESKEVEEYAAAYSEMKPKAAAAIFESMTDNLELVARILSVMTPEDRGDILGAMDPVVAAKVTKIMDPQT